MIGALLYLRGHSFVNMIKARVRRLKQPKYLIGAIVGLLYFYAYFLRHLFSGPRGSRDLFSGDQMAGFEALGAFVLFLVVLIAWVFPKNRAALNFTEAEVSFLFPAPVSRRTLIHYKLVSSQINLMFTALVLSVLSGRFSAAEHFWMPLVSYWLLFATLGLHFLGASFVRTMLFDRGLSLNRWRIFASLVAIVVLGALFISVKEVRTTFDLANVRGIGDVAAQLRDMMDVGFIPYLLWPFRMLVAPLFAREPATYFLAIARIVGLYIVQYFWVLRMNVAFEEASVEQSKKRAEIVAAARRGEWKTQAAKPRRAWFKLAAFGPPQVAIFWKNLISTGQRIQTRMLIIFALAAAVPITMMVMTNRSGIAGIIGMVVLMFLFWSVLVGPSLMRQDFRQDLPNMDMLKTLPMRGSQIVLGQVLAPATVLTLVQWLLVVLAICVGTNMPGMREVPLLTKVVFGFSIMIVLPAFNLLSLMVPNAAVLLFPAWFQTGKDAPHGIEATGQRIVFALGQLVVLVITLVPVAAIAGGLFALVFYLGSILAAALVGAIGAVAVLAVEIGLGVWLLGKVFERFDISAES